jgi:hypothetical protein
MRARWATPSSNSLEPTFGRRPLPIAVRRIPWSVPFWLSRATKGRGMAEFSATDAAIEGFRLAARKPGVIAIWSLAQFLFALVSGLLFVLLVGADAQAIMGPDSVSNWDDTSKAVSMLGGALKVEGLALLLLLPWKAFMLSAVFRAVLRPQDSRLGYLRLGPDEGRMLLLVVIFIGLSFVALTGLLLLAIFLAGVWAGVTGSTTASGPAALIVLLLMLGVFLIFSWLAVRLSFAGPLTFEQRRLNLFGSWKLTRGRFWALSGVYLISFVLFAVVYLIGFPLALVIGHFLTGEGIVPLFQIAKQPNFSSLQSYFTVPHLVMMALQVLYTGLAMAVMDAPVAAAFRMLARPAESSGPLQSSEPDRQPTGPWG